MTPVQGEEKGSGKALHLLGSFPYWCDIKSDKEPSHLHACIHQPTVQNISSSAASLLARVVSNVVILISNAAFPFVCMFLSRSGDP